MPKKFAGENSKAVAARARKSEKAEAENLRKEKERKRREKVKKDNFFLPLRMHTTCPLYLLFPPNS